MVNFRVKMFVTFGMAMKFILMRKLVQRFRSHRKKKYQQQG